MDSIDEYQKKIIRVIDFSKKIKNYYSVDNCLILWYFNPKTKSLIDFPNILDCDKIETLELLYTNLVDFTGIGRFKNLKRLCVFHDRNLLSFDGLTEIRLLELSIENSHKIQDYDYLDKLKLLKKVELTNCNSIDSLDFILHMSNLIDFRFMKTDVKSGDLTPLLIHKPKLEYTAFSNKRHFSHTLKQIQRELKYVNPIIDDIIKNSQRVILLSEFDDDKRCAKGLIEMCNKNELYNLKNYIIENKTVFGSESFLSIINGLLQEIIKRLLNL